jgi:subtilisin
MAQEKDERPGTPTRKIEASDDAARRTPGTSGAPGTRELAAGANGELTTTPPGRRREHYVIGTRNAADGQSMPPPQRSHSMDEVVEYLSRQENVEIVKRVKLGSAQPFTAGGRTMSEVVVAKIEEGKAQQLRSAAPPHLIIERDGLLLCADYVPSLWGIPAATLLPLRSLASEVSIRVVGERDQPLAKATVVIDGGGLPAQGVTDESGTARINFFGGSIEAIRTLFIRAASNYWDRMIAAPRLTSGTNAVRLRSLSQSYADFPNKRLLGWGQRLMGIAPGDDRVSGRGVRIGLIDSGCDTSHPLLRRITQGKDFTAGGTDASWTEDLVAHGTHCAGLIGASSSPQQGIIGCAPEAELHVFKVIPGGRVSDLLAAIDECIERELDLINVSVVTEEFSELVARKLQEARHKGIACVMAAGNTGGPVAFPATLPGVMAVAAVGKLREFPADSSHALTVIPQLIGADDIFAANFSGAGPQIAVSGPGVAVVSTVPGGYAAADGTSAAAALVTGFAALVLAHHPLFKDSSFRIRSERRVQALFELVGGSAVARFPDLQRGGAGVPDLRRVPGSQSLAMGFSIPDVAAGRFAIPPYWPVSQQGVPPWSTMQTPTAGGFF